jgi:hypothetical protein
MTWIGRTDIWAVVISAVALTVSGMSWLETRQQLRLTAGQVRSYVQVVDVRLLEPVTEASFIKLQLRLKNFGQTAAINVYGEMDYARGMPDHTGRGNEATRRQLGSMGPGMERTVILTSNRINRRDWPAPRPRNYETIYFFGTVWFTDDTTRQGRKEDWCYELPVKTEGDLKRLDPGPCGVVTFESHAG